MEFQRNSSEFAFQIPSERSEFAVFSLLRMSESDSFRKHEAGQDAPLGPGDFLRISFENDKNLYFEDYYMKQNETLIQ